MNNSNRHRVLLVDPEPRDLAILRVSLGNAGLAVATASSGAEALRLLEAHPFDVVVANTALTDLPALELCQRLRHRDDTTRFPIILIAERPSSEERARAFDLGVEDYLRKPVYPRELLARISFLLSRSTRERLESRVATATSVMGRLAEIGVVDLLQTVQSHQRAGVISLRTSDGREGTVYFRGGQIFDAEAGPLLGEEAVYRVLGWTEGTFEVEWKPIRRAGIIDTAVPTLLAEGMRRLDAAVRLLEALPPLETVLVVDLRALARAVGELPETVTELLRLFDGRRTIAQVISDSPLGDLAALTAIHSLFDRGLLTPARLALAATSEPLRTSPASEPAEWLPRQDPWPRVTAAPPPLPKRRASEVAAPVEVDVTARPLREPSAPAPAPRPAETTSTEQRAPVIAPTPTPPPTPERPVASTPPARAASETPATTASGAPPAATASAPPAPPPVARATSEAPSPAPQATTDRTASPTPHAVSEAPPPIVSTPSELPIRPLESAFAAAARPASPAGSSAAARDLAADEDLGAELMASRRRLTMTIVGGGGAVLLLLVAVLRLFGGPHAETRGPTASAPPAGAQTVAPAIAAQAPAHPAVPPAAPPQATQPPIEQRAAAPALAQAPATDPGQPKTAPTASPAQPAVPGAPPAARPPSGSLATTVAAPPTTDVAAARAACREAYHDGAGKYAAVLASCSRAADADPADVETMLILARTEADRGRDSQALAWAQKAIDRDPNLPDAYLYLGSALEATSRKKEARAAYQKYIELAPTGKHAGELRTILSQRL